MVIETDLKLNTIDNNFRIRVLAKQLDSNSRFLNCTLYNGDTRINVDQGTVIVNAKRSSGESHSFAGSINEDGSVRVPIANWMTADAGMVIASVSVLGASESKLTSASFVIDVQEAENPDGEVSPDDPNVDVALQIVSDAQAAADRAEAAAAEAAETMLSSIAPAYSSSSTYAVGDYVFHSGALYRCITAITTAEAWTAAHWTQVAFGDDVSDLKSAINQLDSDYYSHIVDCPNLFNPNDPDIVDNVELKNTGATASKTGFFASGYIPVKPGKTICCHYPTGTYGKSSTIVFYDENKNRIGYTVSVTRRTDANNRNYISYTFSINSDAKYIRLTGYMANKSYYMYIYADEMPSTYIPYTTNKTLEATYIDYSMVKNVNISKNQTAFIDDTPVNLVDLSALVPGIITSSTANGNIDTSGSYGTNWVTTDYIPVEPGETYALCIFPGVTYGSGFKGIPYYDENKTFLGRVTQSGGSVWSIASRVTITIPNQPAIKYIRTSYYKSYTDSTGSDHKRWWQCQIFHASAWPTDMYVPFDDSDRIVETRLDDAYSAKYNPLWGKSAMWNGDSICAADSDTGAGWPGRIASVNGMKYKNYGISGGTIAENTGTNVHSVSATLNGMLTDFPNADYIIIEGGTNDADILGDDGIGTFDANDFSSEYITALDKDTFSGALESIFYRLVTQMKTKHIGYLIPQKMGHTEVLVTRRRTYFDRAIAICQKWGIPYLDLWNGLYLNWRLAAHWDQTMTNAENETAGNLYLDGQHLTTTGYAVEAPIIAEWMKKI